MLLELIEKSNPGETSLDVIPILTYELGDLSKMLFYRYIYGKLGKDLKAYNIEAKIAMSDILAQCSIICEREKWDFDELRRLGINRCTERIKRRLEFGE